MDIAVARGLVAAARDVGITHFDVADIYGAPAQFGAAEEILGQLRHSDSGLFAGAFLATKVGVEPGTPYNSDPDYLRSAIENSLRRLRTDCVDLLYIHRPDMLAHPEVVAKCLDDAVTAGKARSVGVSNYSVHQLAALMAHMSSPIGGHQLEFSPLVVDAIADGRLDQAMQFKVPVFAWSPLAGGRLIDGADNRVRAVREGLSRVAGVAGVSIAAAALAFAMTHPSGMMPMIGTRNIARLRELAAASAMRLDRSDWYSIYQVSTGVQLP